jgi:hypothetical protein
LAYGFFGGILMMTSSEFLAVCPYDYAQIQKSDKEKTSRIPVNRQQSRSRTFTAAGIRIGSKFDDPEQIISRDAPASHVMSIPVRKVQTVINDASFSCGSR